MTILTWLDSTNFVNFEKRGVWFTKSILIVTLHKNRRIEYIGIIAYTHCFVQVYGPQAQILTIYITHRLISSLYVNKRLEDGTLGCNAF